MARFEFAPTLGPCPQNPARVRANSRPLSRKNRTNAVSYGDSDARFELNGRFDALVALSPFFQVFVSNVPNFGSKFGLTMKF